MLVYPPGDLLLAAAGFSLQEDSEFRLCHPLQVMSESAHDLTAPQLLAAVLVLVHLQAERLILLLESAAFHGAPDGKNQIIVLERLGEIIVSAVLDCFERRSNRAVGRDDNNGDCRIDATGFAQ